jgi:hypothetical protein
LPYVASDDVEVTRIEYARLSPGAPSFWPVTVTVLGTFHPVGPPLDVENVSELGDTTPSDKSLLARLIVTVPVGAAVSTTVNVAVPPVRVVVSPLCGEMEKFFVSLSTLTNC